MITEKTLIYERKIENKSVTSDEIERFIFSQGIEPVRYAIVEVDKNKITISVSGINLK